jgi:hypothetical protein
MTIGIDLFLGACKLTQCRGIKVKSKVPVLFLTEHHAMKAYWGSEGIAPLIL